jgi:hypothetical protein
MGDLMCSPLTAQDVAAGTSYEQATSCGLGTVDEYLVVNAVDSAVIRYFK